MPSENHKEAIQPHAVQLILHRSFCEINQQFPRERKTSICGYALSFFKLLVVSMKWFRISGCIPIDTLCYQFVLIATEVLVNFMVTPCINNIQHFNFQLTHTTLKKRRIIKIF